MVAAAAAIASNLRQNARTGKLNGGGRRGHIIKLAAQRWSGEAHWWRRWRQQAYKRSLQWRDWFGHRLVIILASSWDLFGIILTSFWNHFGVILESCLTSLSGIAFRHHLSTSVIDIIFLRSFLRHLLFNIIS